MRSRSTWPAHAAVFCVATLAAQTSGPQSAKPDPYAAEPLVIERSEREIVVAADGTGTEQQLLVVRVQSDATAKTLGVISLPYASGSQRLVFDSVRVRHPDGTVTETPVADALDLPTEVMRQAPFYSDLKEKQLPVRNLRMGDRLEWRATLTSTKAEAPGRFWGVAGFTGKDRVALAESVTLRVPKGVSATVWSPKLPVTPVEEASYRVYRWTSSQLETTTGPAAEARAEAEKKRALTPEEIADRTDGALPQIAWTNFPDWAAVGAWYRELAKDRVTPDAAIKAKATELIAGKTTDEDKVRALYSFVSGDIRYIGVALGQGRYQPHLASEVLRNQYGDCKDKATLLASLLDAAGFPADTALIGPDIRFNEAVPMPSAFNHAITAVHLGAQTVWLDSTQEVAPYRALLLLERNKQVLRIPQHGPAALDLTPADLPFASIQSFQADGAIDVEGMAKGHLSFTFRGDAEIVLRAVVRQVSPAQYDQTAQYLLSSWGFGGKVVHATFTLPTQTAEPFVMAFDYERDKPGNDWSNYRIVALDAPDELPTVEEKDPPRLPIDLGTPRTIHSRSELALPAKWGATLPDAIHQQTRWVKYDRVYSFAKNTLIEDRTVTILQRKIPAESWRDYKKFSDAAGLGSYPYIQLTRNVAAAAADSGPPSVFKDDPEARRLVGEAAKANEQHQLDRSAELIAKARAINQEQPYLASVEGYRAMLRGEVTEAAADYTRELALHPGEGNIYSLLTGAQLAQGRRSDGEETLRRRLKAVGPDPTTSTRLTQMLLEDEKQAEALSVAEEAIQQDPSNLRLQLLLGRTRVKTGNRAAGQATLLVALRASDDAGLSNDLAYELADSGTATPEVEAASRRSVDQLTTRSAAWTLTTADQDIREMRRDSTLLAASWDTLGWTIFQTPTGRKPERIAEAKALIDAAWHDNLHAEVGLHLGELQEAEQHGAQALLTYQLAAASALQTDLRGVRQPLTPLQRELEARISRLKASEPYSTLKDPEDALRTQMKSGAGPAEGKTLVAPYRFLVTAQGVQSAVALEVPDTNCGKPDLSHDLSRLRRAMPEGMVPQGSAARLLRSGVLNCHQTVCELVLSPLGATR